MFRLAHISDIHLGPLPKVKRAELFSKRLTGYVNFRRNRTSNGDVNITAKLTDHLATLKPDHTVITGDLINIGLDEEFSHARKWLQTLGSTRDNTVILGNHDAYVRGARARAFAAWQDWVSGDDSRAVASDTDYPVLRRRGPVSIIACNSARASAPFMATGYFRKDQGERLRALLREEHDAGRCRVVLIHHAPFPKATSRYKRLLGLKNFMAAIADEGAELILHGHTHLATIEHTPGPHHPVPVVCVPAAFQWFGHKKPPAAINMIEIGDKQESDAGYKLWEINLTRHALDATGNFKAGEKTRLSA
jgi:3',5'-cyclic AMP phosphodiesterase CpdA